jgi:hypothetical protein
VVNEKSKLNCVSTPLGCVFGKKNHERVLNVFKSLARVERMNIGEPYLGPASG